VATLRAILRAIVIVDGLVCLYALVQACALIVQERRRTLAVLRACGADQRSVRRVLIGAVVALVLPSVVLGLLVERLVFGPTLARLAASYATLPLGASAGQVGLALVGLAAAGWLAVILVARQAGRESVVAELA
jgi:ABC-type antimicrobial peptide transport system permease subunit